MKVTIRAMLININEEKINTIDNLMTAFCSALRYSFKRLREDMKKGDVEKAVSQKYGLNIRQSKDAVENARQTISSQKELVKRNYENYLKKVTTIEKIINDKKKNLSDKKKMLWLRN